MAEFDKLVKALRAAGEVTRLRLLALLASGELSVKDFTDILGQSQPRISRHLKLLSQAGLVTRNVEGAWVFYRASDTDPMGSLVRDVLAKCDKNDGVLENDRRALKTVQKLNRARADAYFAQVAQSWDALRKLHVAESAVESAILRVVGGKKIDQLLDLGTGTGRMLELLADRYSHGVGVDSSREMIAFARAKINDAKIAHAQVKLGDILAIEKDEIASDLIVIHQVLHYFADPGSVLVQTARRLKEDGRVLVVDFAPHKLEFLREEHAHQRLGLSKVQMQAWAHSAGLKITAFESHANKSKDGLVVCLWTLTKN